MTPNKSVGVPNVVANGFNTGVFDIVELKTAKAPITQKTAKYLSTWALIRAFNSTNSDT